MTENSKKKPTLFLQFAGQGVRYLDELQRIYNMQPAVRPFILDCITEIQRQSERYDDTDTGFFNHGLDIETWLIRPETAPDPAYLLSSPLSHPLIFLTQTANFLSFVKDEAGYRKILANCHSATGFSTGVVAAVLFSLDIPFGLLLETAVRIQAMFFWQGIRTQEAMFFKNINPVLSSDLVSEPSCMANISPVFKKDLDCAISDFAHLGTVYAAYEILPGRWIVAGSPADLEAFSEFVMKKSKKYKWRFIPSTIAAHSPFLDYALETSPKDAIEMGVRMDTEKMRFPVFSNEDGVDLRKSNDIIRDIMEAYFVKTAIWKKQIRPLFESSGIKYVLDFGPGPGVAGLTESFMTRSGIRVIRCTTPPRRKQFEEEVLPGLFT